MIIRRSARRSALFGDRLPILWRYATSSIALTTLADTYVRRGANPWSAPAVSISANDTIPRRAAAKRRAALKRSGAG